jgi:hypothetical protein
MSKLHAQAWDRIKTDAATDDRTTGTKTDAATLEGRRIALDWLTTHCAHALARCLPSESEMRLDSSLAVAARQVEYVYAEVYEETYPDLPVAEGRIAYIDTSVPEGARSWVMYMYSGTSIARIGAPGSDATLPTAMRSGAEISARIHPIENAYSWTFDDMRSSVMSGVPLEPPLRTLQARAHAQAFHRIGLWGRLDLGTFGFLTHPNITIVDAAASGTGNSRDFRDKDIDDILADFRTLIDKPRELSKGQRHTTHVLMSERLYTHLATTLVGTSAPGMFLLEVVKKAWQGGDPNVNGGVPVQFGTLRELDYTIAAEEAAADDGTGTTVNVDIDSTTGDCMIAYVNDRKIVSFVQPMVFKQHPVQTQGLTMLVPCESKVGGCKLPEPLTVARMEQCWLPD